MLKKFCKWYLNKTAADPSTICFCPGCGINLTVNGSYVISYLGKVDYKCTNCACTSSWLFDCIVPILLEYKKLDDLLKE